MPAMTRIFIIHMIFHVTLGWSPLPVHHYRSSPKTCLTGHMTDVQNWLNEQGNLIVNDDGMWSIDLSYHDIKPVERLQEILNFSNFSKPVKYLSMAVCGLHAVPMIFGLQDHEGRSLSETLEAVSFYGNKFVNYQPDHDSIEVSLNGSNTSEAYQNQDELQVDTTWNIGFRKIKFPKLQELDLRSCSIQYLNDDFLSDMSELKALYLSGNNIYHITSRAFNLLKNLVHLDLSRNKIYDDKGYDLAITWSNSTVFCSLTHLASLDFSFTLISETDVQILSCLQPSLKRLSLCYTGIKRLPPTMLRNTSLKYLDVSGNNDILTTLDVFQGLEDTLEVVYADGVGIRCIEFFINLKKLRILKLSNNELTTVKQYEARSLKNLEILDLSCNKISSWFNYTFSLIRNLQILSLRDNNINIMKAEMIEDLSNIKYIGLGQNFYVCTCYAREFLKIAAVNENRYKDNHMNQHMMWKLEQRRNADWDFHTGFYDYYDMLGSRNVVTFHCDAKSSSTNCSGDSDELIMPGKFLLIDYTVDNYKCLVVDEGKSKSFSEIESCKDEYSKVIYERFNSRGWTKLVIIIAVGTVSIPCLVVGFVCRRRILYFFVTVKNSALLSSIGQSEGYCDGSIFHYDVFVSYCNEDRPWVLDHLLPHVERDSNVSVCLHERDFQVGLSILENIVSCMDRSRAIMLIISHRFLLSQWCQFEMHLAQHRLLETRREDLILVLLEDIPRRMRPNTLHYLMMTKTYVLWPKEDAEHQVFWRRLKKGLVTQKLRNTDNSSLV